MRHAIKVGHRLDLRQRGQFLPVQRYLPLDHSEHPQGPIRGIDFGPQAQVEHWKIAHHLLPRRHARVARSLAGKLAALSDLDFLLDPLCRVCHIQTRRWRKLSRMSSPAPMVMALSATLN